MNQSVGCAEGEGINQLAVLGENESVSWLRWERMNQSVGCAEGEGTSQLELDFSLSWIPSPPTCWGRG
jgi:hypothetical protein